MTGVLLFIVLPLLILIVGGLLIALFTGSDQSSHGGGIGNNFIDWLL